MTRLTRAVVAALVLVVISVPVAGAKDGPSDQGTANAQTTQVQILGLNDFHGALEPPAGSGGRIGGSEPAGNAGGVEFLATHVRALRATNPNTLFVSAGDLIGATPLISALFHDEPSIEAFNLMGLDFNGVGNHEFDEGVDELLRMQNGGCHPVDGCQDGDPFGGATFDFLAANVKYKSTGETIFPPYAIRHFPGVKVAIIGMTLEGTPQIVTPAGISHVDFFDEAETVNALVPKLKQQNIETIIVLLHEGGSINQPLNPTTINQCNQPTGAIPPIVTAMDDEVDVVVTGHTNWAVNCVIDGKIVTGAASAGRLVTDIDLTISRSSKDVVAATVENKIVTRTVAKAPDLTALIAKYGAISKPLADRVIGKITADITRTVNVAQESALGDVIADAQLFATTPANLGGAVIAFMNPGGIRTDLLFGQISGAEAPGEVTYGEAFNVQPFGNSLVTMTLSGAQIEAVLEQQWCGANLNAVKVLQVSDGFEYTYDGAGLLLQGNPPTLVNTTGDCDRINPADITLDDTPISPMVLYRVTVNSFLATGGDGFSALTGGTNPLGGDVDLDALEKYLTANPDGIPPGPQDRITRVG
jgi:5'-nucleotidase